MYNNILIVLYFYFYYCIFSDHKIVSHSVMNLLVKQIDLYL